MKETLLTTRERVMEPSFGKTAENMLVNGRTENNMERVCTSRRMGNKSVENGKTERKSVGLSDKIL